MCLCVKSRGCSWLWIYFGAPALRSLHSSCDWCAPVADRAEARAQGPTEADVYLWLETASVRGSWSSNILILTNTALGLIFYSERTHQSPLFFFSFAVDWFLCWFLLVWTVKYLLEMWEGNCLYLIFPAWDQECLFFAVSQPNPAMNSGV